MERSYQVKIIAVAAADYPYSFDNLFSGTIFEAGAKKRNLMTIFNQASEQLLKVYFGSSAIGVFQVIPIKSKYSHLSGSFSGTVAAIDDSLKVPVYLSDLFIMRV